MRSAEHQRFKIVNIIGLFFFQLFYVFSIKQKFLLWIQLLKGAFARNFLEVLEDRGTVFVAEDELIQGEKQEEVMFKKEKRFDLIYHIGIIGFQSLCQMNIELIPSYELLWQFLLQERRCFLLNHLYWGFRNNFFCAFPKNFADKFSKTCYLKVFHELI